MFSLTSKFSIKINKTLLMLIGIVLLVLLLVGCDVRTTDYRRQYENCMGIAKNDIPYSEWLEFHKTCTETAARVIELNYSKYSKEIK